MRRCEQRGFHDTWQVDEHLDSGTISTVKDVRRRFPDPAAFTRKVLGIVVAGRAGGVSSSTPEERGELE